MDDSVLLECKYFEKRIFLPLRFFIGDDKSPVE